MYIGRSAKHHYRVLIHLPYRSSSNKDVFTINVAFAPSDRSYESDGKFRSSFTYTVNDSLNVYIFIFRPRLHTRLSEVMPPYSSPLLILHLLSIILQYRSKIITKTAQIRYLCYETNVTLRTLNTLFHLPCTFERSKVVRGILNCFLVPQMQYSE